MPLEAAFQAMVERHGMLRGARRVVVAVSGGADSTALLCLLHGCRAEAGVDLLVAHLDHGWRGESGATERLHVQRLADSLGVPAVCEALPAARDARGGGGREARARAGRAAFLERVAREAGADRIATGHNRDDQAETVLLRLLRGSGGLGLAGIPPVRLPYIRPLLGARRAEIEAWLRSRGIPWIDDPSNRDPSLLRNRVRGDLLPFLEQRFGGGVTDRLASAADLLRDDEGFLEGLARHRLEELAVRGPQGIRLPVGALSSEPAALRRRLLRLAAREVRGGAHYPDRATVERLDRLLGGSMPGPVALPHGLEAEIGPAGLLLRTRPEPAAPFEAACRVPGRLLWAEAGISLTLQEVDRMSPGGDISRAGPEVAFLDSERTGPDLVLRSRRDGDAFRPLGLGGRKKVQDFLVDAGVPRPERARVGLLTARGEIAWVVGHRIDERFKVTDSTRKVLVVTREGR